MFHRLFSFLIVSLSFSHAADKLDPGYEIPGHVRFILRTYQAIDKEDATLINPAAFDRADLHQSLTLFFDPHWGGKPIPESWKGLNDHYNKRRKICTGDFTKILTPYWAHLKCLEVLEGFDRRSYITRENILEGVPVTLTDALTGRDITHVDHMNMLLDLSNAKKKPSPTYSDSRKLIPLDVALPTVIENPLFLMAFADNVEYLVSTLLTVMKQFNTREIEEDQFAHILKARMRPDDDLESTFQFDYINWYITHYNVFEE